MKRTSYYKPFILNDRHCIRTTLKVSLCLECIVLLLLLITSYLPHAYICPFLTSLGKSIACAIVPVLKDTIDRLQMGLSFVQLILQYCAITILVL